MTRSNRGLIFVVSEPKRTDHIREYAEQYGEFTDTASAPDIAPRSRDVALISFDGQTFAYAALVTRGNRIATAKYVIRFSRLVALDELQASDLAAHVSGARMRSVLRLLRTGGGLLTSSTWDSVWAAVRRLRDNDVAALDELATLATRRHSDLSGPGYAVVAEEKDAVLLAAAIFGIDRRRLDRILTVPDEPAPFLRGLADVPVLEDIMIQKDKTTFGDWIAGPEDRVGSVEMRRANGERLTIINVNRTRVEETLGVDLIYYSHKYKSFVMVQYKTMYREEDADGRTVSAYRPVDKSYRHEITRMDAYLARRKLQPPAAPPGMRLSSNPFLFKLCPKVVLDPLSTKALQGMYLPFEYWKLLVSSPTVRGSRGGIRITYENAGRHINNGLFVELVQDGWIGSAVSEERQLSGLIAGALEGSRSVVYASASPAERPL